MIISFHNLNWIVKIAEPLNLIITFVFFFLFHFIFFENNDTHFLVQQLKSVVQINKWKHKVENVKWLKFNLFLVRVYYSNFIVKSLLPLLMIAKIFFGGFHFLNIYEKRNKKLFYTQFAISKKRISNLISTLREWQ